MDLLYSNRPEQRPCGRRLTRYAAVSFIALFQLPLISSGQPKASTPATATGSLKVAKWKSGGYKGIATGKSRITDVRRLFGEPVWSGAPEQALIHAAPADEIWHEYKAPAAGVTSMTIVVGKRSGVVEGILLYRLIYRSSKSYGNTAASTYCATIQLGPVSRRRTKRNHSAMPRPIHFFFCIQPEACMSLFRKTKL